MRTDRKGIYHELFRIENNKIHDKILNLVRDKDLTYKILFEVGCLSTRLIHRMLDSQHIIQSDFRDGESLFYHFETYKTIPYYGSDVPLKEICTMRLKDNVIELDSYDNYGRDQISNYLGLAHEIEKNKILIKIK